MDCEPNESQDNTFNEQIYESIDECVRRNDFCSNNENAGIKQPTACYGLSATINPKKVLKTSADKLCDTFNNVKTKFGTLSQRLRRSTRRRTPLINSPGTPIGRDFKRTPVKMYSPFSIETPRGKENTSARRSLNRESFKKTTPPRHRKAKDGMDGVTAFKMSPQLSRDIQQVQFRDYELRHTAERILTTLRR